MNETDLEMTAHFLDNATKLIRYGILSSATRYVEEARDSISVWAHKNERKMNEHPHWERWWALDLLVTLMNTASDKGEELVHRQDCEETEEKPDETEITDAGPLADIYDSQLGIEHIRIALNSADKAQAMGRSGMEAYYLDLAWARILRACSGESERVWEHPCWGEYKRVAMKASARAGRLLARWEREYGD